MSLLRTVPTRGVLARPGRSVEDVIVFLGVAALLWLIVRLAHGVTVPCAEVTALSTVSTDPAELPYYAARSLLRMFVALALSIVFTFVYAMAAARLRRAEKVLLPLLDILQSVPILGFLRRRPGSPAANWCGCSGCPCGTPRRFSVPPPLTATDDLPCRDRPPSARSGLTDLGENPQRCSPSRWPRPCSTGRLTRDRRDRVRFVSM
jgi:hypothetical protein